MGRGGRRWPCHARFLAGVFLAGVFFAGGFFFAVAGFFLPSTDARSAAIRSMTFDPVPMSAGSSTSSSTRLPLAFAFLARSEEHTSELQSLMRISYAVFCLKKKTH